MRYNKETLKKLFTLPRIAGVKEGSWEFCAYEETLNITQRVNPNIPVMASGDEHLFPCFALGTQGSIVSLASVIPEAIIALYKAIKHDEWDIAKQLHLPIQSLANLIYGSGGSASQPTLNIKAALAQEGEISGKHMRAPVAAMPEGIEEEIHCAMSHVHKTMEATAVSRAIYETSSVKTRTSARYQ
nr:dihydrodipicolinate synthase family protein [Halomonas socia]